MVVGQLSRASRRNRWNESGARGLVILKLSREGPRDQARSKRVFEITHNRCGHSVWEIENLSEMDGGDGWIMAVCSSYFLECLKMVKR